MKSRHTHSTTKTRRLLPLLAALCLCASAAAQAPKEAAQKFEPTAAQRAEAGRMRAALAATVSENFEIARDRLVRRSRWHGGTVYWLAHLRARKAGEYYLRYKYRYKDRANPRDPLYTFVKHQTLARVGPRGCERRPRYNFICVGDTFILPVLVGDHSEHTFSIEAQPFSPANPETAKALRSMDENRLHREPVPNPAARFMKYLGSHVGYSPHRTLGYTATYEATFEAVAPGSFNLAVGTGTSAAGPLTEAQAYAAGSVPVVVVDPKSPVTALSRGDNVHGYTERFSSNSGNNYRTTPVILQPGELFTIQYLSYSWRGGYSRRGLSAGGQSKEEIKAGLKDRLPVITLLPFRYDPAQDFNEWLVESLPPSRRE